MTVLPKNGIEPSDSAVPVAHVDGSGAFTLNKAALGWAGRKLDGNNAEKQNDAVPDHKPDEGIQNKLKVAHHTCREDPIKLSAVRHEHHTTVWVSQSSSRTNLNRV
jgi:hypothetical protein